MGEGGRLAVVGLDVVEVVLVVVVVMFEPAGRLQNDPQLLGWSQAQMLDVWERWALSCWDTRPHRGWHQGDGNRVCMGKLNEAKRLQFPDSHLSRWLG
ncbi:MAG: hypothetical protein ABFS03_11205 [Chloroflexota bacterium]